MNYLTDEELPPLPKPRLAGLCWQIYDAVDMLDFARAAIAAYLEKHRGEVVYAEATHPPMFTEWHRIKPDQADWYRARGWTVRLLFTAPQPTPQERQDAARRKRKITAMMCDARGQFIDFDDGTREFYEMDITHEIEDDAPIPAAMSKEPDRG